MSNSNRRKDLLLGQPHGTAGGKLRKAILFKYVKLAGHDICFRCGRTIETIEDLSIEHTVSWQLAPDPVAAFFDLDRIAFSHLRCNVGAGDKSRLISRNTGKALCDNGHEFDEANTYRQSMPDGSIRRMCKICRRDAVRRVRARRGVVQVGG